MSPRRLLRALEKRKWTLAVAESYTGGRLQDLLTNVSGSSKSFVGGVIAYDNAVKTKLLKVSPSLIRRFGAVSPEVALAMARGARRLFRATVAVSTTGIAGPTGATPTKPRGLSWVAVVTGRQQVAEKRILQGSRVRVKDRGARQALSLAARVAFPQPLKRRRVSRRT